MSNDGGTDDREKNNTAHTRDQIVFTGIVVIAVLLLTWFAGVLFGSELSLRINAIGAIGSIVLSFALFTAYLSFIDVQRDQLDVAQNQSNINKSLKELQGSQSEYIRANHEPHLTVKYWNIKHTAEDNDVMTVTLENQGNGLAKNMRIVPEIEKLYEDADLGVTSMIGTSPGNPNHTHSFSENRLKIISDRGSRSFALVPGNSEKFNTTLTMLVHDPGISPSGDLNNPYTTITDMLNNDPDDAVYNVKFKLKYESILGNTQEDVFIQNRVRRDSESTLSELLAKIQ